MINKATIELIGYVYGEPKYPMPDKHPNWITFSISVTEKYKDKQGEEKKDIQWFKCNSWGEGLSIIINKNIKEGNGVLVKGKPKAKAYIDKEGNAQTSFEVNVSEINILTYPKDNPNYTSNISNNGKHKLYSIPVKKATNNFIDDELPF